MPSSVIAKKEFELVVDDQEAITWGALFNTTAFYQLHQISNSHYFKWVSIDSNKVLAVAHFSSKDNILYTSPLRGTFGGVSFLKEDYTILKTFIKAIEDFLKLKEASILQLSLPKTALLFQTLATLDFHPVKSELSYALKVSALPLESRMKRNNQKRLRKCRRANMQFFHEEDMEACAKIFEVIEKNRASKAFFLSMNFEQIWQMQEATKQVLFFGVRHEDQIISGSVCIKVSEEYLYVFYWGDLPGYEKFSPVVFLAEGIYQFGQRNQYQVIDVGTAMLGNELNEKLATFKLNLGCEASLKFTVQKRLSKYNPNSHGYERTGD